MPSFKTDYSKTIIYKIQHNEKKELLYIGHTTNFDSRKYQHSRLGKGNASHSKFYETIQANGGWEQFTMSPVKRVVCQSRIDALIEEQKVMDELQPALNKMAAFVSTNEQKIEKRIQSIQSAYEKKTRALAKREADYMKRRGFEPPAAVGI